jgi:putative phage-type endonuclease
MTALPFQAEALPNREAWLVRRRLGLGGTDVAAILGKHAYVSPIDVWLDKKGLREDRETSDALEMGIELEPVIARRYTKKTGVALCDLHPFLIAQHPTLPWAFCSPDDLAADHSRGVELKSVHPFAAQEFGDSGGEQMPDGYFVQCAWSMAVTELPAWDLAAQIGYETRIYPTTRDADLCAALIDQAGAWWDRYVIGNETPPVDGTEGWGNYLKRKFPKSEGPMVKGDAAARELAIDLARVRKEKDDAEFRESALKHQLQQLIGEGEGIEGDGYRITWRRSKDGTKLKTADLVVALTTELRNRGASDTEVTAILKAYTEPAPGSRRFTPTFKFPTL